MPLKSRVDVALGWWDTASLVGKLVYFFQKATVREYYARIITVVEIKTVKYSEITVKIIEANWEKKKKKNIETGNKKKFAIEINEEYLVSRKPKWELAINLKPYPYYCIVTPLELSETLREKVRL